MLKIQSNIPLAPLTTFKIGGPAKFFYRVSSAKEIKEALKFAQEKNLPYFILGGGSNLLIADEGFPGLVIKNEMSDIFLASKGEALRAYSGTKLQELVDFTISHGLFGMHKLTGIYGTVGGAIFGNTGAYGQTISDYLIKVAALDPKTGEVIELNKDQCGFDYRDSEFKRNHLIILEVYFQLPKGDIKALQTEAQELLKQRVAKLPFTLKCPGSFFKNIPVKDIPTESLKLIPQEKITFDKVPVAVLLEMVGAKRQRKGNIQVSETHANLIFNTGEGKASDVYKLAQDLIKAVRERFGITLEPEVQFINVPLK